MTLQKIMSRAHQIARQCKGDYAARLALGLRQAWMEARLIRSGGSRWQKNGMDRIYFNDLSRWFGLETNHYKTGNISSATLDGDHVSNSQARKIAARFSMAKFYFDVADGKFHGQGMSADDFATLLENIKATAKVA